MIEIGTIFFGRDQRYDFSVPRPDWSKVYLKYKRVCCDCGEYKTEDEFYSVQWQKRSRIEESPFDGVKRIVRPNRKCKTCIVVIMEQYEKQRKDAEDKYKCDMPVRGRGRDRFRSRFRPTATRVRVLVLDVPPFFYGHAMF